MASSNNRSVTIDPDKFEIWAKKVMKEHGIKHKTDFGKDIGYNKTFYFNVVDRGYVSAPAVKALEFVYGLNVEDIMPDPPNEELPEPNPVEAPVETAKTADLTKLEDMVKQMVKATIATQQMTDDIRKGFRVQTTPRLDVESISEGVKAGMEAFWRNKKEEIVRMLNGIIFAGSFEAGKKLDELRNDQQKVWKVK